MCGTEPDRKLASRRVPARLVACVLAAGLLGAIPARAGEGLWDRALETLNIKAPPPGPAPAFVDRTRPDPAALGYMPTALPHKVSPTAVKTPAEIEKEKAALDAARARQLNPAAPTPLQIAKAKKAGKPASAPAVTD